MHIIFKPGTKEYKNYIYNNFIDLVTKYEDLTKINIDIIKDFENKKLDKHIQDYTLIFEENNFVGCFLFTDENEYFELDDLYIKEEYRSRGIGTYILKKYKNIATCNKPLIFYVFKQNKRALDLYLKLGFIIIEDLGTRVKMSTKKEKE